MITWLREWWSGAATGAASNRERMVCAVCGGWIEFPRGQVNRAAVDWHAPDSQEEAERRALAAEFEAFTQRHRAHAFEGEEILRIHQPTQRKFWQVDPSKRESLGGTGATNPKLPRP